MNLFKNPFRHDPDHFLNHSFDFSHPPDGGLCKACFLGVLLPCVILFFASQAWINEKAIWFGSRYSEVLTGHSAKWMAGAYLGAAGFCFSRWFLGLLAPLWCFNVGTVLSILTGLASMFGAFLWAMA